MVMARRAVTEGVSYFIHINHYSRALWGHWGVRFFFFGSHSGERVYGIRFCGRSRYGRSRYRLVIYLVAI